MLWIVLVGGSLVAGAAIVGVLVSVRSREPLAASIGVLGFIGCAWAFGRLGSVYASIDVLVYAFGLAIGGLGGGYALASALLDRLSAPSPLPTLEVPDESSRARLLLFSCAEAETYDPKETSRELRGLADEALIDLTIGVTPFMYAAQKARYRAIGGASPARGQARQLAESLEAALGPERFDQVDTAWCDGPEWLPHRVASAVRDGCRRIVVAVASVGESAEMAEAKRAVDQLRLADLGVSLVYTRPLWGSEPILSVLTARILAAVDDAGSTGVALIAHGQPETREKNYVSFDADESAFVNRVRMMLAEHDVEEAHVLVAWAEWRDPDVTSTVRHLAALGCTRILVVPACFAFDGLVTRLDVPVGVRQARTEKSVSIITLNAWTDDRGVVEAITETIREASDEALAPSG